MKRFPSPLEMIRIPPPTHLPRTSALLVVAVVLAGSACGQSLGLHRDGKGEVFYVSYQGTSDWLAAQKDPRSHLHKLPALDSVALNNHRVSREAMAYLCGLKGLKFLEIGWGPEGVLIDHEALAEVAKARNLEELTVIKSGLRDEDLAFLPALKKLSVLEIEAGWFPNQGRNRLTGIAAASVARCEGLKDLRITNLMGVLPDSFVSGLGEHPGLELVSLRSDADWSEREDERHFSDTGAVALARCQTLIIVQLSSPNMTRASISPLLALPRLADLSLSVGEIEAEDLGAVRAAEKLESLSLRRAAPTDEQFAELAGHPSLTTLVLDGRKLTLQSRVVLESLPKLETVHLPGAPAGLLQRGERPYRWTGQPPAPQPQRLPPGVIPWGAEEILPPGVRRR